MKIITNYNAPRFGNTVKEPNEQTQQQKPKKDKYVDPLANWPMRGFGYTNDIGIAINELAPATARLFWVPALMYFGADIYDKYKNKGDKYKPNAARAFNQAVFQACASILFPAVFGHIGMSAFSQLDKYKGLKISTNAKEQTLRFIKSHSAIHDVMEGGMDREQVIDNFITNYDKYYKAKKKSYNKKNIFVKTYDTLLANCKLGAVAKSNEDRIKQYAKNQFIEILDSCRSIDVANNILDKKIFKLKVWKSAGAFTAILLTAQAIDKFVEKVIIKKFVKPLQNFDFAKYNFTNFNPKSNQSKESENATAQ